MPIRIVSKYLLGAVFAYLMMATNPNCSIADTVLKDHVSDHAAWNDGGEQIVFGDFWDNPGSEYMFSGFASFIGNGQKLKKVGGLFNKVGPNGEPNEGPGWDSYTYLVNFYPNRLRLSGDPYLQQAGGGAYSVIFQHPSNTGYQVPVGTWSNGKELHYLEFDVSALNITTAIGGEQYVAIIPLGFLYEGGAAMAHSVGGGSTQGNLNDWIFEGGGMTQPIDMHNFGPYSHGAYKVVTSSRRFGVFVQSFLGKIEVMNAFECLFPGNC